MSKEQVYDLNDDTKCSIEDDTPCKMKVALGFAANTEGYEDLESVQFSTPKLQKIFVDGRATKSQMVAALEEWAPSLPADRRQEGFDLVEIFRGEASANA